MKNLAAVVFFFYLLNASKRQNNNNILHFEYKKSKQLNFLKNIVLFSNVMLSNLTVYFAARGLAIIQELKCMKLEL